MKKVLGLISVLLLTLLVISCGTSKKEVATDVKQTLTLAVTEDSTGDLNPHVYGPSQFITQDMVYEGLVAYGENGVIKPMLAESWTVSEDGKTYTFNLRKGVKFSDGSDFTANTVKKNFDTIFSPENRDNHAWFTLTNLLESWKVIDEYTFEFTLKTAYSATFYDLAMIRPIRFLADTAFNEDGDSTKGIKASTGTGPWMLKEHKDKEYAVYVRNENYWGEKPVLEEVVIKVVPDAETLALEFEAGNVDLIYGSGLISLDRFNSYREDSKYTTGISEPMSSRLLLINTTSGVMNDVNVRRALSHAIDKEAIAKNIFGGVEKPANTIFAPNVPNTNIPLTPYKHDIALAEKMLDEAGWVKDANGKRMKNGKVMKIVFPYISSKIADKNVAEYFQGEWAKLGMEVELKALDESSYWKNSRALGFDVMLHFSWGAPWDPHAFLQAMADSSSSNGSADNRAQQGLPMKKQLDETITQLLVEPDEAKVKEMYKYVLTTLHEEVTQIPLTYQSLISVYRTGELGDVKFMPEENRLPVWDTKKLK